MKSCILTICSVGLIACGGSGGGESSVSPTGNEGICIAIQNGEVTTSDQINGECVDDPTVQPQVASATPAGNYTLITEPFVVFCGFTPVQFPSQSVNLNVSVDASDNVVITENFGTLAHPASLNSEYFDEAFFGSMITFSFADVSEGDDESINVTLYRFSGSYTESGWSGGLEFEFATSIEPNFVCAGSTTFSGSRSF